MKIVLDGKERAVALEKTATVDDVLATLKPIVDKENRIICDVCVDGVCLSTAAAQDVLRKGLTGKETIEVRTDNGAQLARETLQRSQDFLNSFERQIEQFLDVLQLGGEETAFDTFIEDIAGLKTVMQTIELTRGMFNIDFERLTVGDQTVNQISDEFMDVLIQIQTAITDQDLVYLQDLLRYELIPATTKIIAIMRQIEQVLPQ